MNSRIKQLLREAFDKLSVEHDPELLDFERRVYDEGKKLYPKLTFKKVKDKYNGKIYTRVFTNYSKNKGSYSVNAFKTTLATIKIHKTFKWLNKDLIKNVNHSKSTNSLYFNYKGKNVRMSDHKKHSFKGINIVVKWDDTAQEIVDQFI